MEQQIISQIRYDGGKIGKTILKGKKQWASVLLKKEKKKKKKQSTLVDSAHCYVYMVPNLCGPVYLLNINAYQYVLWCCSADQYDCHIIACSDSVFLQISEYLPLEFSLMY